MSGFDEDDVDALLADMDAALNSNTKTSKTTKATTTPSTVTNSTTFSQSKPVIPSSSSSYSSSNRSNTTTSSLSSSTSTRIAARQSEDDDEDDLDAMLKTMDSAVNSKSTSTSSSTSYASTSSSSSSATAAASFSNVPKRSSYSSSNSSTTTSSSSTSSSFSSKCYPVILTNSVEDKTKEFCRHSRCTACDFDVVIIQDSIWRDDSDYLFFRNNTPNVIKLKAQIISQKGSIAYCCQCSWQSVSRQPLNLSSLSHPSSSSDHHTVNDYQGSSSPLKHLQWVCAGHSRL